MEEERKQT